MNLFKRGNMKISSNTGITCLPTEVCALQCPGCYARRPELFRPNVLESRRRHLEETLKADFVPRMVVQIQAQAAKGMTAFRPHESGDFYSQEYVEKWAEIARNVPGIWFYTYTKAQFCFASLDALPNFNLIRSKTRDGGFNFGDRGRVEELRLQGYKLCPCQKGTHIVCGEDCTTCHHEKRVCFLKH